ncbi:FAD-binding protein [Paraburkholderia sp. NMBU_R16]|uniref:FAD-binding protein n=1 Tax=Paraburkholderia sp. NMBU_R16 TaxID=2698676 RepID=UPI0015632449|nr:FAD-binding protein [Paraburkholderia sp. NMBU_R16]NRO98427.1 FAD-binding protein [Paraburkholderia sp. NMBU_R16]
MTGAALAVASTIVGFDPTRRSWIDEAQAAACPSFTRVPPLDGKLVMDSTTLAGNAHDEGNMLWRTPCAVLYPASVDDISKMIRYCGRFGIGVSPNTGKNSVFGQTLVDGGLMINMRSLATIHSITSTHADVDGGVLWMDLIKAAFAQGVTPASITGYTQLGVAGTLSIGGLNAMTSNRDVWQVNHVAALQAVTGNGDIVRCSAGENTDLFNALRAGLGQCGVITRATVEMVPAKTMARLYRVPYADIATFFSDVRTLAARGGRQGGFDWVASVNSTGPVAPIALWAAALFDPSAPPPPTATLMQGCSALAQGGQFVDMPYLDYVFLVDTAVNALRTSANWDRLIKPWINVVLPDSGAQAFVESVVPALGPQDLSATTFLVIVPVKSGTIAPLLRVPPSTGWHWVFGLLTNSTLPGPDPSYSASMLARNYRLWQSAVAIGGTRYLEDAVPFSKADWQMHYGAVYEQFAAWKRQFDPHYLLGRGASVF